MLPFTAPESSLQLRGEEGKVKMKGRRGERADKNVSSQHSADPEGVEEMSNQLDR